MIASSPPPPMSFANEVAQFSFISCAAAPSLFRHPGLDPGSIPAAPEEWIPDQVRDDDGLKTGTKARIAREVAQFSGLLP